MFSGAYYHTVDDKGRTKIPSRFGSRLGSEFVATRGMHGCIWVFEQAEWEKVLTKLEAESLVDSRTLTLQRFFLGTATECSLDPQGRLALPAVLRDHAGIDKEILVIGACNKIEIWSKERWDAFNATLTDDKLEELGRAAGL
jgi:transcriptional regulator MraZ